jgi:hypothetical protein
MNSPSLTSVSRISLPAIVVLWFIALIGTAAADDMRWQFYEFDDPDGGGQLTAQLSYGVPETDDVLVSGVCDITAGADSRYSELTFGGDVGSLTEGEEVELRFSGGGFSRKVRGTVSGTDIEEGVSGVLVRLKHNDPLWSAFVREDALDYLVPGYRASQLNLRKGRANLRAFRDACHGDVSETRSKPRTVYSTPTPKKLFRPAKRKGCRGGKWIGRRCVCPEGLIFDAGRCSETDHGGVNCAGFGQVYHNGACMKRCPRGYEELGGFCSRNEEMDSDDPCGPGFTWSNRRNRCISNAAITTPGFKPARTPRCRGGTLFGKTCVCPDGFENLGGTCSRNDEMNSADPCGPGFTWSNRRNRCISNAARPAGRPNGRPGQSPVFGATPTRPAIGVLKAKPNNRNKAKAAARARAKAAARARANAAKLNRAKAASAAKARAAQRQRAKAIAARRKNAQAAAKANARAAKQRKALAKARAAQQKQARQKAAAKRAQAAKRKQAQTAARARAAKKTRAAAKAQVANRKRAQAAARAKAAQRKKAAARAQAAKRKQAQAAARAKAAQRKQAAAKAQAAKRKNAQAARARAAQQRKAQAAKRKKAQLAAARKRQANKTAKKNCPAGQTFKQGKCQ